MNQDMHQKKILSDLIHSAAGAKAHYEIWWFLVSEAIPQFVGVMNQHSDFFRASRDAHYQSFFVYFAHFFDRRTDSSSLPTYLSLVKRHIEPQVFETLQAQYDELAKNAVPLLKIRHKTVAHIDAKLSEKDVFAPLQISWNEINKRIYDTTAFVDQLAGPPPDGCGKRGVPRDGRLKEATFRILNSL